MGLALVLLVALAGQGASLALPVVALDTTAKGLELGVDAGNVSLGEGCDLLERVHTLAMQDAFELGANTTDQLEVVTPLTSGRLLCGYFLSWRLLRGGSASRDPLGRCLLDGRLLRRCLLGNGALGRAL